MTATHDTTTNDADDIFTPEVMAVLKKAAKVGTGIQRQARHEGRFTA
jgi:hypothetical protein